MSDGSPFDLFHPRGVLLVGVETDRDDPAFDRVYIGSRHRWRYVLVTAGTVTLGPQHTTSVLPPDAAVYVDDVALLAQWWVSQLDWVEHVSGASCPFWSEHG